MYRSIETLIASALSGVNLIISSLSSSSSPNEETKESNGSWLPYPSSEKELSKIFISSFKSYSRAQYLKAAYSYVKPKSNK